VCSRTHARAEGHDFKPDFAAISNAHTPMNQDSVEHFAAPLRRLDCAGDEDRAAFFRAGLRQP
jgi:hypothetical protein